MRFSTPRSHFSGPLPLIAAVLFLHQFAHAQVGMIGDPDRLQSRYWECPVNTVIPSLTEVHKETINLSQSAIVYVQADGTTAPSSWPTSSIVRMWITIDGQPVGNTSVIDWQLSVAPQIHCFNSIGSANLSPGQHDISLWADSDRGTFTLGARSNLCVFVNPANNVMRDTASTDSPELSYSVKFGTAERCTWGNLPHHPAAQITMDNPTLPVFAFASARIYRTLSAGDGMISIFREDQKSTTETQTHFQSGFSVDDLWLGAESQGPVYVHGILTGTQPAEFEPTLSLGATEYPPSIHPQPRSLRFRVGSEATLITMFGGLTVQGSANNTIGSICDAICIGGVAGGCPPMQSVTPISSATFNVPAGHDGVVLFAAKARVQGNPQDGAVSIELQLRIDGNIVGSFGNQGLAGWLGGWDATLSQRTVAVSYLATGVNRLTAGQHTVELVASARSKTVPPRTTRVSVWDDAPFIIWVD